MSQVLSLQSMETGQTNEAPVEGSWAFCSDASWFLCA